jgi:poly-gamma-glutamate synthesis protein (capsule biosynthesis protein)
MATLDPHPYSLDDKILESLRRHPFGSGLIVFIVLLSVWTFGWGFSPDASRAKAAQNAAPSFSGNTAILQSEIATSEPLALPASISPALISSSSNTLPVTTPQPVIHLLFTGDINPGRCLAQAALHSNNFTKPYQYVADKLASADLTIGSLDGSISDLVPPLPCEEVYNLIGPARTTEGLVFAGFDVISVATNHALDCGSLGWRCDGRALGDTRKNLLAAGIQPVGIGGTLAEARMPVILERQGVRFAFLGVNAISGEATWATDSIPGTAPLSDDALAGVLADIAAARAQADVVIVMPHWGVEYASLPDAVQEAWAARMIAAGADLVIGNHAHIAQPVQTFPGGGAVAYALGNFVFDQGTLVTKQSLVFEAVFHGSKLESWRLLPVRINNHMQPRWAAPPEEEAILNRIAVAGKSLIAP